MERTALKLPAGKLFGVGRFAFRCHLTRALDSTFLVGHILKGLAEHLLLVQAVRTPVKSVHLCLLRGQAFCKIIVTVILTVGTGRECANKKESNDDAPNYFLARLRFSRPHTLALPLSPLFRHASFLYHGLHATTLRAPGKTSNCWQ